MSVTAARGFAANGMACGIKASGAPDLALVATTDGQPVPASAVFTANRMTAAPVLACRDHLAATGGRASAVVLNSGNANAATGADGRGHAQRMAAAVAGPLGCRTEEVLVCSTGLIGIPLPVEAIEKAASELVHGRSDEPHGAIGAADAILTTDTVRKESVVRVGDAMVGGMAKGAAMLAPDMATMLAVLTTDAAVEPGGLSVVLTEAVAETFNRLSVDGCTSTNDTVILLASGHAGPAEEEALTRGVTDVCRDLALQIAGDAEGATKVVRVQISGAASNADAERAARRIADSSLVKCSWYGEDPYWGRIASEAGSAGVTFDADRITVGYGGVTVARSGVAVDHDAGAVAEHLAGRYVTVTVDLGLGEGRAEMLTNDLGHGYIDENMGTS